MLEGGGALTVMMRIDKTGHHGGVFRPKQVRVGEFRRQLSPSPHLQDLVPATATAASW